MERVCVWEFSEPEVWRSPVPALAALVERAEVWRLPRERRLPWAMLGLRPGEGDMALGPLRTLWLGADPPRRSTHFLVSPVAVVDGALADPGPVAPEEQAALTAVGTRLGAKELTFLPSSVGDAALVWERLGDLGTTAPGDAYGEPWTARLPEGDGERTLRRFVHDSGDLLVDHEVNLRRVDEGRPPLSLLWPWAHGVRAELPNLAARRGEPLSVGGGDWPLEALARGVGYRVENPADLAVQRLPAIPRRRSGPCAAGAMGFPAPSMGAVPSWPP